jgi:hypothetical protein
MIHLLLAEPPSLGEDNICCCIPCAIGTLDSAFAKLQAGTWAMSAGDVDLWTLRFRKWARTWEIVVWLRKPYSPQEREETLRALKSVRFGWTHVKTQDQAICNAIEKLPADAQADLWPTTVERRCGYEATVRTLLNYHMVQFIRYFDNSSDEVQGRWYFLVRPDGSAESIASTSPNKPLQPTAPREGK